MTSRPRSPLASPALGTSGSDLVEPCRRPGPRPAHPAPPATGPAVALTWSGGGFRATLSALGTGRLLADVGLLGNVRLVSSVSGGSVASGLLACAWDDLEAKGFTPESYDELVVGPLLDHIAHTSLAATLARRAWRIVGPATRTDLLADAFDDWFFRRRLLEDLSPSVRWVLNAANLTTGVRFGFERDVCGDYVLGLVPTQGTGLRLARAVAASAAVPSLLAPVPVALPFPCAEGRQALLFDGGVYDNLGLEVVDDRPDLFIVALNAGGVFHVGAIHGIPFVRDLMRANALLYRQATALRTHEMVERFQAWEQARRAGQEPPPYGRQGVLVGLSTTFAEGRLSDEWAARHPQPGRDEVARLATVGTSFNRFDRALCEDLVHRGWWLAGAALATFHRHLLPDIPAWRPVP